MDELEPTDQARRDTIPFPKKRGRLTNAERAARSESARTPQPTTTARPLAAWLPPTAPDADTLARLKEVPEPFRNRQSPFGVVIDLTQSTLPHDAAMRSGAGGIAAGLAGHALARTSVTVTLMGFNTRCGVLDVSRGGFTLPPELDYRPGTYLRPVLDKTAAAALAFNAHVVECGAVPYVGPTCVISDFQAHDWEVVSKMVPAWKEFMRRNGQVVVSAMIGDYDLEVAKQLSDPVPPVPVDKVSFGPLFKILADSLGATMGGRSRLEVLLTDAFSKLS